MKVHHRTEQIGFKVRPHERDLIERAAEADRKRLSEHIRDVLLEHARRRADPLLRPSSRE